MSDKRIDELNIETAPAAADVLPIYSIASSATKQIKVKDLIQVGAGLVDNASIPVAKIANLTEASLGNTSAAGQFVAGPSAATGALTKRRIVAADLPLATASVVGGVSASTGLAVSGAGVLTVAAATTVTVGGVSVPGASGLSVSGAGELSHTASISPGTTSGVTVSASGHVTALAALVGADLPLATTSAVGGVSVGNGLAVTGAGVLNHAATITGATLSGITFNGTGHITAATALVGADLPVATSSVKGAVSIPAGALSVDGSGVLTHDTSGVAANTYPKVAVDSRGHVTSGAALDANDIPNISAAKITSGTLGGNLIGANTITGAKLADQSTVQFGGAGSTASVVTFPVANFKGQLFWDELNNDMYIWSGSAWLSVTVTSGELILAGTFDASSATGGATGKIIALTAAGTGAGFVVNDPLPAPSTSNKQFYFVVSIGGTPSTGQVSGIELAPPDNILSTGVVPWQKIDISATVAGNTAANITFSPAGTVTSGTVQLAIQELDTEKLPAALTNAYIFVGNGSNVATGVAVSGDVTITNAGAITINTDVIINADIKSDAAIAYSKLATLSSGHILIGSSANVATARAVTGDVLINNTGVTSINTGVIVNDDINNAAAIADTKLAQITTAGKVSGSAITTGNISTSGNITTTGTLSVQGLTVGKGNGAISTNTAVGFQALNANTTGASNVAIGYQALKGILAGSENLGIGNRAGLYLETGSNNVAIGSDALQGFLGVGAANNIAIGRQALFAGGMATSIGIGNDAGNNIISGANNVIIGHNADASAAYANSQIVIGAGLTGKGDNTAFIGGSSGAYNAPNTTTWTTTSDERIKKNIVDNKQGLSIINRLRVRNFEYRQSAEITAFKDNVAIQKDGIQLGLIAQELQKVLPDCVTKGSTGVLSVNTDPLLWYLINAVQELAAKVEALEARC